MAKKKENTPDVEVANHGSVMMFHPRTDAAKEWIDENVQLESWQWFGSSFAVEPRFAESLVEGMQSAGLNVV